MFHFENGKYQQIESDSDGMICSKIIPDLCFRELPRDKWTSGHKIELWFRKEEIFELGKERLIRKQAEKLQREAEFARQEAEFARWEEQKKREEAEKKAMVLAEKLKALGIDPDSL